MDKISETAFLVAMYRAIETERPDALFQDPLARRLAGGRGAVQAAVLGQKRQVADAIAIRTRAIDDLIERLVRTGIDTVLNLAAGLDTRPYRLSLPPNLVWIEVDLPEVLAYKAQALQGQTPVCTIQQQPLDLIGPERSALLARVNTSSKRTLIITEGLLGYLSEEAVAELAADLSQRQNFGWWILEVLPPMQSSFKSYDQKLFDQYLSSETGLQFRPAEGAAFFRHYGWKVSEVRTVWQEARRLQRGAWAAWIWEWLFRLFARRQWQAIKASGVVLLERM